MGNSSNAYSSARPLQGSVVDLISGIEQQDNLNREVKYRKDKDAKEQQDKNDKDLRSNLEKASIPLTGWSSHDEVSIDLMTRPGGLFDKVNENTLALQNPNIDQATKSKLIMKSINYGNTIESIKKAQTEINGKREAHNKGLSDGILSPYLNKGWSEAYNSTVVDRKYSYGLDEMGNLVVNTGNGNFDRNGDNIPDTFTLNDIYDPAIFGPDKTMFKDEEWFAKAATRYGNSEVVKDNTGNYVKTTREGFDLTKEPDLIAEINDLFGSDVKKMTSAGISYLADKVGVPEPKDISEEDFSAYKDSFKTKFTNSYKTVAKDEKDYGAEASDQARRDQVSQFNTKRNDDKIKDANENKTEEVPNTYGQSNSVTKSGTDSATGLRVQSGDKIITVVDNREKTKGSTSGTLKTIAVHKNGKISISVEKGRYSDELSDEAKTRKTTWERNHDDSEKFVIEDTDYKFTKTQNKTYSLNNGSDNTEIERALINMPNPITGKPIKTLTEARLALGEYAGFSDKKDTKSKSNEPEAGDTTKMTNEQRLEHYRNLNK